MDKDVTDRPPQHRDDDNEKNRAHKRFVSGIVTRTSKRAIIGTAVPVQAKAFPAQPGAPRSGIRRAWERGPTTRGWTQFIDAQRPPTPQVQAKGNLAAADSENVRRAAHDGVQGSGNTLPSLQIIQERFGAAHDLSRVQADVGGTAAEASKVIGARAYAMGEPVAFREAPNLHPAAHVVQQRTVVALSGDIDQAGER